MSRKHTAIDPECGRRLKSLLVENGVTQCSFAKKFGYEPQHISNIVTGKRRLTEELAQKIVCEEFSFVNVDWLMHRSEFKTIAQKEEYSQKAWKEELEVERFYDRVFRAFIDGIENLCGYGLYSQGTDPLVGDYIVVSDSTGKEVGVISLESFDKLRNEIENFASYSINRLIKNEMKAIPKSEMDGDTNG